MPYGYCTSVDLCRGKHIKIQWNDHGRRFTS